MSKLLDVVTSVVSSISIILCIIGNSLVCAVIKKNRDMRLVTDKSLNLSLSGFGQYTRQFNERPRQRQTKPRVKDVTVLLRDNNHAAR